MDSSKVSIADSVVLGDVNQRVEKTPSCPSCNAMNVIIMACYRNDCNNSFCEVCHPECRLDFPKVRRFDSGLGSKPMCESCLISHKSEKEKQEKERKKNLKEKRLGQFSDLLNNVKQHFHEMTKGKRWRAILLICLGFFLVIYGLAFRDNMTPLAGLLYAAFGALLTIIGLLSWTVLEKSS